MSQMNEGIRAFLADAALAVKIRVKATSTGVDVAGAGEEGIGSTIRSCASGGDASVKLDSAGGTQIGTASGSITAGNNVYSAASGALSETISGRRQGIALQSVSTGEYFEFMPAGVTS